MNTTEHIFAYMPTLWRPLPYRPRLFGEEKPGHVVRGRRGGRQRKNSPTKSNLINLRSSPSVPPPTPEGSCSATPSSAPSPMRLSYHAWKHGQHWRSAQQLVLRLGRMAVHVRERDHTCCPTEVPCSNKFHRLCPLSIYVCVRHMCHRKCLLRLYACQRHTLD